MRKIRVVSLWCILSLGVGCGVDGEPSTENAPAGALESEVVAPSECEKITAAEVEAQLRSSKEKLNTLFSLAYFERGPLLPEDGNRCIVISELAPEALVSVKEEVNCLFTVTLKAVYTETYTSGWRHCPLIGVSESRLITGWALVDAHAQLVPSDCYDRACFE